MAWHTHADTTIAAVKLRAGGGWDILGANGTTYRTSSNALAATARDLFFREVPVRLHYAHGWLYKDLFRIEPRFVEVGS